MKPEHIIIIFILVVAILGMGIYFLLNTPQVFQQAVEQSKSGISRLAGSDLVRWDAKIIGNVKLVSETGLTVGKFGDPEESEKNIFVPISEKTALFSFFVLPKNIPADQIAMKIDHKGKTVNLGERRIKLGDIQEGDSATVSLRIKAKGDWEAEKVSIYPANLSLD
jgi:preprotein translocase subunit YajC